ncbi:MAG TPA: ABC transporter ATP-binding protein [Candidatus Marinimicrobia bacterium]|jgi:lipoprotein-releasing system ATP-binding protein|nr:ABC transporter ATP-binding protein [Candidatus Neomarinimicrobiota bacterium]MDP7120965.1 ABC transporter ATP-binding protein [Candidatus Neomarinimicrobiota bacterium]MDP7483889.1 ABC transporter ATP-binding protein [Candidatus Neomarinimicrobiota bacterium]MDP7527867.1 ABC transporter ATP-binding protein [Candidatus Neomarinimicrobiota bacterium]MDP7716730.1 ABC transporter ATP-binding protein [Candidatus Neomarinimicrobiota bacterium]|tara:strand:- start:4959 stop:5633 length:675 start_codon:yes stop_codon:yes gene_type:complete
MILKAENICKSYPTNAGPLEVLKDVSLSLKEGEMISVAGPSGCGKSTLLNILGTLDHPDKGTLEITGINVALLDDESVSRLRSESIGFVFQFHHLLPEFTIAENLMIPQRLLGRSEKAATDRVTELLSKVNLLPRSNHRPNAISGGERQRVAVLRALVNEPGIVLADEPTGNLDVETARQLMEMIQNFAKDFNQAFLIVTHNPDVAALCEKNLTINGGTVIPAP